MKQLNIAIIGQGRSGRGFHGSYILSAPDRYRVVYVVDSIPERRRKAEQEYGCPAFADYQELYGKKDIDVVVNAGFSHLHVPITLDLLEHGFNVLCEKPLAQTAAQVDELIARRDTSGRMLAVFQQSRFEPYFEQLKAIIASGVLGRIVQISMKFSSYSRRWDWQTLKEFGGGILYNKGPHPLDQALNLLDFYQGNPGVFCKMDRTNTWGDAEDYVKLIVTAPGRPLVDLEISSCDAYAAGISYAVQGTSGGLEGNEKRQNWRWFVASETPGQELTREPLHDKDWNPLFCEEHINWHEDSWQIGPGNGDANGGNADGGNADADGGNAASIPVGKLYANVYEHLLKGIPLIVTPEQVRQQIWVMEEAHRQNPLPG